MCFVVLVQMVVVPAASGSLGRSTCYADPAAGVDYHQKSLLVVAHRKNKVHWGLVAVPEAVLGRKYLYGAYPRYQPLATG